MRDGVVRGRVRRDPGEQGGLGEGHVVGAVAEVDARRLLDAVGAVAEVDRVQVGLEDPLLRPALAQLPGQRRLAHLPADRALILEQRVLDELLRDRRAALDHLLLADVGPEGAPDAANVDAAVLPVAAVLDRDDRMAHQRVDVLVVDERPRLRAAQHGEHRVAVVGVDDAVDLLLDLVARIELGDLAGDRRDQAEAERDRAQQSQDGEESQKTESCESGGAVWAQRAYGAIASGKV